MRPTDLNALLLSLRGGLIVSCQARSDNPLYGPAFMAAMAAAAQRAGAVGIRANGAADVAAIRARVRLPIIGINKRAFADGGVIITPDLRSAREVVEAGAEIVAISCARHQRPDPEALGELIDRIHSELGAWVMADCATAAEGVLAARLGADIVATTLSGYTPDSPRRAEPDLRLVAELASVQPCPVIAEGRIWTPEQAAAALAAGAHAVVVGTAITNPEAIAARFAAALAERREHGREAPA